MSQISNQVPIPLQTSPQKALAKEPYTKPARGQRLTEDDVVYFRLDTEKHTAEFVDMKLDDVQIALYQAGMLG